MIKVIIENKIPFIKGLLDDLCDVVYLSPEDINRQSVRDADALIVRTRTRCDESLLDGSRCRFIATATIGTDHIDLGYCRRQGITVKNAPGCNAPAVAQYTFASIARWLKKRDARCCPELLTIGIIGVGNVGSIVEKWARSMGMKVLLCDPPRAEIECSGDFVSTDEIAAKCDIITFHTPHVTGGKHPTHHLCDEAFLNKVTMRPLVINCARGPIVDTPALVSAIENNKVSDVVIDCWEGEPSVSPRLLSMALIATPHIAGYSLQGKIRATRMVTDAFTQYFGLPRIDMASSVPMSVPDSVTLDAVTASYDPMADTVALKATPQSFESLRNNYVYRNEVR